MNTTPVTVEWREEQGTLATRVAGLLTLDDVTAWRNALVENARRIPTDGSFKMLIDIRDYEVADQEREVHMVMREVMPLFLAGHGFAVGFFRLYEVEPPDRIAMNALCTAVAHVHHDSDKMDRYNELLSTSQERFFSEIEEAESWLLERRDPVG